MFDSVINSVLYIQNIETKTFVLNFKLEINNVSYYKSIIKCSNNDTESKTRPFQVNSMIICMYLYHIRSH